MSAAAASKQDAAGRRTLDRLAAERSLSAVYDDMACAVWVRDTGGQIIYSNRAAEEVFGFPTFPRPPRLQELGYSYVDADGEPMPRSAAPSMLALRSGRPQRHQVIGVVQHGRPTRWVLMDSLPVFDAEGAVQHVVNTAVDITDLKEAELALRSSEDRNRRILETTHEGICCVDQESCITYVNSRLCDMLGYRPEELLGRKSVELIQGSVLAKAADGHRSSPDVSLRHKDGTAVWVMVSAVPVFDDFGAPSGLIAMFTNVTDRKLSEDALRQSEARYRAIIEHGHDVVVLLDRQARITYQSPSMTRLMGAGHDSVGKCAFDHIHPADVEQLARDFQAVVDQPGSSRQVETRFQHPDGTWHWAEGVATNLLDEPAVGAVVANFRDVTERHLAEERARMAAEQIERLTADAIITVDGQGRVVSWNHGAEQIFGWSKDEVIGQALPLVPDELRGKALADVQRIIERGEAITQEARRRAKDGRTVPVLCSWSPVPLQSGGMGVLGILKDLSDHKRAAAELRETSKSLAVLRERERIAMDLHDGVIQSLYGVTLSLGALRRKTDHPAISGEEWSPVLGHAIGHLTGIIQGIRDYIYDLRTGVPEEGDLLHGLDVLAEQLEASTGVRPAMEVDSRLAEIEPAKAAIVLYVAREALSNVARHAHATKVAVQAGRGDKYWSLAISDNGRGFDPAKRGRRRGDGLHNMRERARLLGGRLIVRSKRDAGTTVRLVFA